MDETLPVTASVPAPVVETIVRMAKQERDRLVAELAAAHHTIALLCALQVPADPSALILQT